MNLLTKLKENLLALRELLSDEQPQPEAPKRYCAERRGEAWCVTRKGSVVFGPWRDAAARERASNLAHSLNHNRVIRLAQKGAA